MKFILFLSLLVLCGCEKSSPPHEVSDAVSEERWYRGILPGKEWPHRYILKEDSEGVRVWVEQSDDEGVEWFSWEEAIVLESSDTRILFKSPWGVIGKAFPGVYELTFENTSKSKATIKVLLTDPVLEAHVSIEPWSQAQQESQKDLFDPKNEVDPFDAENTARFLAGDENDDTESIVDLDPAGRAYFPKGRASYYTEYLAAMKEPSLMTPLAGHVKKAFRFTYLRSFDDPIVIRLILVDDVFDVSVVLLKKDKKHKPVEVTLQKSFKISPEQTKAFLRELEAPKLWLKITKEERNMMDRGRDGSTWLFEKHDSQGYTMLDIWTPQALPELIKEESIETTRDFMALSSLGTSLLKLGGVLPTEDKLY